jgi:hypothetical protein
MFDSPMPFQPGETGAEILLPALRLCMTYVLSISPVYTTCVLGGILCHMLKCRGEALNAGSGSAIYDS